MLSYVSPDMYLESIYEIPLDELKLKGIKGLIIDLDNTITEWNNPEISSEARDWFEKLKSEGFKVCLASNNNQKRVVKIADSLGIPYIAKAGKPRRRAFKQAIDILKLDNNSTAVIGDQIFTDVLGGNRLKLYTVLVVPMGTQEFVGTKFVRLVERQILKCVMK